MLCAILGGRVYIAKAAVGPGVIRDHKKAPKFSGWAISPKRCSGAAGASGSACVPA